jgi:hypothetical protein
VGDVNETRTYQVHDNGDGTFRLRRVDKGTFTTLAGTSPGNCVNTDASTAISSAPA